MTNIVQRGPSLYFSFSSSSSPSFFFFFSFFFFSSSSSSSSGFSPAYQSRRARVSFAHQHNRNRRTLAVVERTWLSWVLLSLLLLFLFIRHLRIPRHRSRHGVFGSFRSGKISGRLDGTARTYSSGKSNTDPSSSSVFGSGAPRNAPSATLRSTLANDHDAENLTREGITRAASATRTARRPPLTSPRVPAVVTDARARARAIARDSAVARDAATRIARAGQKPNPVFVRTDASTTQAPSARPTSYGK